MYNLIEYSSVYKTAWSLWFYSKDKETNVDADIANTDDFKSFKYKVKLLGNAGAQATPNPANEIIKNETIAVAWKYFSNFLKSL